MDERTPKKLLHTKMEGKRPRERPKPNLKGYGNESGKSGRNTRKQEVRE